jgi:Coenzyme PQQ synthesis protein D (PqqD)
VTAVERAAHPWRRDAHTLSRLAPGRVVLLGPDGDDPIVLLGTGVALWRALDRPQSTDELAISLAKEFDASPDAVRSDIEPVLAELSAAGVVRAV